MQRFAHLDAATADGLRPVSEIITLDDDLVPGRDMYVSADDAFAKACVPCDASVVAAMRYDPAAKTFAAAPAAAVDLSAYAKAKRDQVEAAGITVNGVGVASDPDSQTRVANAYAGMQVTGAASIRFKAASGFLVLSLDQVKAVGSALFAHTQACFDAEDQVDAGLSATPPTIAATAQVDAIFAGVKSAY